MAVRIQIDRFAGATTILSRFVRFAAAGAVGFLIEAVALSWLVLSFGTGIYVGRGISFSLAVTATWAINRRYAFVGLESQRKGREYAGYFSVQVIGALINLGIFALVVSLWPQTRAIPILPLAIGAGIALGFNFAASRYLVFRSRPEDGGS